MVACEGEEDDNESGFSPCGSNADDGGVQAGDELKLSSSMATAMVSDLPSGGGRERGKWREERLG